MSSTRPPLINLPIPPADVLVSLNFVEYIVILICQTVALALFGILLIFTQFFGRRALGRRNLHPSMKLFLLFHCIGISTSIPATVNKVFQLLDPEKHLTLLFWIFAFNCNYILCIAPFFVLFLTVERLLILRWPLKFKQYKKHYPMIVVLLTVFFYCFSFTFFLAELPLDPKISLGSSPGFIRIAPKFNLQPQSVMKMTFGCCNLICCFCFFYLLKRKKNNQIKNRVVRFTIICELIFNISTSLDNIVISTLTNRTSSLYVGVMDNALMNVDLAICATFYTWIFLVVARRECGVVGCGIQNNRSVQRVQQQSTENVS